MNSYDRAERCESVGLFILHKLSKIEVNVIWKGDGFLFIENSNWEKS